MKIGIIGLPNSGKTTIFNALTRSKAEVSAYGGAKVEPNRAVVAVNDERVDRLSSLFKPKKKIYGTIELIDFVALSEGFAKAGGFSASAMALMRNTDALALVVRNFPDPLLGRPQPQGDMEKMNEEILLSDLIIVEGRLEKILLGFKRGQKTPELERELRVLNTIHDQLNQGRPIRDLALGEDDMKVIRGFQFLTLKSSLVVLNSHEETFGKNQSILDEIGRNEAVIEFAGSFEMDLSQLDDDEEVLLFMEDMGIAESARDRLTRAAFEMLGYISFFTVRSDEVRAWSIKKGSTALEAAGLVHTDMARGFIRAECFSFEDLMACGSEKGVREKGLFRLEGKDYIVQDGDILSIRFNV
jgi:GTP-binding protein YchF